MRYNKERTTLIFFPRIYRVRKGFFCFEKARLILCLATKWLMHCIPQWKKNKQNNDNKHFASWDTPNQTKERKRGNILFSTSLQNKWSLESFLLRCSLFRKKLFLIFTLQLVRYVIPWRHKWGNFCFSHSEKTKYNLVNIFLDSSHYKLLLDIKYSSLCNTVGLDC